MGGCHFSERGAIELREGWKISDYCHLMVWIWSECGTCWPSWRTWDLVELSLVSTWTINWFHSSSTSWRSSYTSRTENTILIYYYFLHKQIWLICRLKEFSSGHKGSDSYENCAYIYKTGSTLKWIVSLGLPLAHLYIFFFSPRQWHVNFRTTTCFF